MSYWGFFAKKGHSFIGLTGDKKIRDTILRDRKEDFDCIKLKEKPTENMKKEYSFHIVEITDKYSAPMTQGEEEAFYAYGYLKLIGLYETIEHIRLLEKSLYLNKDEKHDFLISIINIYKYITLVLNSSEEFDEKCWGCANVYNKGKLWEEFRIYEREEDETLESLYVALMDAY